MINENMHQLGIEPNAIRAIFAYAIARKAEIGKDKVFDFSIGNPSIPAPDAVRDTIIEILTKPGNDVNGYTPAQGAPSVREAIAQSLNKRYDAKAQAEDIYMTAGAAASINIALTAVTNPGEEFIVVTPYFPEYRIWIEQIGVTCIEIPARESDFQLDVPAIKAAITPKTRGIIINSPNNPVGVVYSREVLQELADALHEKQEEFGTRLYIISDEPYREIVYDNIEVPFVPNIYENTLVCYSYSKSLSLPGQRIGYLYVSSTMSGHEKVFAAVCGAGRSHGFICATSLFQYVIEKCVDVPTDIEAYDVNRKLLMEGLSALGYEYIEPQGAFYLWVKAPDSDADAFVSKALEYELLLVPSTAFATPGWVRIGYCVSKETIVNAMPAFAALAQDYGLKEA